MVILPRWLVAKYAKREKPVETLVSAKVILAINLPVAVAMDKNWKPIPSFSSTLLELFGVLRFFYPFHCSG